MTHSNAPTEQHSSPANTQLAISFLGTFHVSLDGETVQAFESDKARALFAYLVMEADRPHSRGALAALLWPDWPEQAARKNLRHTLYTLRRMLDQEPREFPFIIASPQQIRFNPDSDFRLDAQAFELLVTGARTHDHGESGLCQPCAKRLVRAVELYTGEFLPGFSLNDSVEFEEWRRQKQEQLHDGAIYALKQLVEYHADRQDYEQAIHYGRHQIRLEPWNEEAHRYLMGHLALSGQRESALLQYEECRQVLGRELDVWPSDLTVNLFDQIRSGVFAPASAAKHVQVDHRPEVTLSTPSVADPPVAQSAPAVRPHNLPAAFMPMVDRQTELAQLCEMIEDPASRLLTVAGIGGIGKSSLAMAAARRQTTRSNFRDGIYYVSLDEADASAGGAANILAATILEALTEAGAPVQPNMTTPENSLLDFLSHKETLLVLDNFEHLLSGATFLVKMLKAAPDLTILTTSRERLSVQGECVVTLDGLDYPAKETTAEAIGANDLKSLMEYPAIHLFIQRAKRSASNFELNAENAQDIVDLCHTSDGMPLALTLAASWMYALTPGEILGEMARDFSALMTSRQDMPERHRNLNALFDNSWQLLSETEQAGLIRLAQFSHGFDRHMAAEASVSLFELAILVKRSLLRHTKDCYTLHPLLRQYILAKLPEQLPESEEGFEEPVFVPSMPMPNGQRNGRQNGHGNSPRRPRSIPEGPPRRTGTGQAASPFVFSAPMTNLPDMKTLALEGSGKTLRFPAPTTARQLTSGDSQPS